MTEGSVGTWKDILSEQSYHCSLMRFMEAGILYNSSIISSPNTKVSLFPYFMNVIAMLLLTSQSHGRLVKAQATESLPVFLIQWNQHPSYFPKRPWCCSLVTTYLSAINPLYWQLFKGSPPKPLSYTVFPPWAACGANQRRLCKQRSGLHLSS